MRWIRARCRWPRRRDRTGSGRPRITFATGSSSRTSGSSGRRWSRRRARLIEAAADAGRPLPTDVPWWAPPVPQDARATATVACLCLLAGVAS